MLKAKTLDREISIADYILSIEDGFFFYINNDKYNYYLMTYVKDKNTVDFVVTDKYFTIENISEIENVDPLIIDAINNNLITFKMINDDFGDKVFLGKALADNKLIKFSYKSYSFNFEIESIEEVNEEFDFQKLSGSDIDLELHDKMKNIEVFHSIRVGDNLYFVGIDHYDENDGYVFGIYNINSNMFNNIYTLYSDYVDIIPLCLTIDPGKKCVVIVGKCYDFNNDVCLPFLESFLDF